LSAALLAFGLALLPLAASGAEPLSLETVAAEYFRAQTYCDSGHQWWRPELSDEFSFVRCARRDGRFKLTETYARAQLGTKWADVKWSDGKTYYRYLGYSQHYDERPLDDPFLFGLYKDPGQVFPVFVFQFFAGEPSRLVDVAERERYLRSFAASASLSSAEQTVFERTDPNGRDSERLWVVNATRTIVRHERLRDGAVTRYTEIRSRELNRPLSDADLTFDVPARVRFSAANNPRAFIAGVFAATIVLAAMVWTFVFVRARALDGIRRWRTGLWRWQLRGLVAAAIGLAILALLSLPGGGHPPAIVFVFVLGVYAAIGFGLIASFTAVSYPVELFFRHLKGAARS